MPGKRVQFDPETWQALDLLARDQMKVFQELADEAFADLLTWSCHCGPNQRMRSRRSLTEETIR